MRSLLLEPLYSVSDTGLPWQVFRLSNLVASASLPLRCISTSLYRACCRISLVTLDEIVVMSVLFVLWITPSVVVLHLPTITAC